ncbi:autotransporter outer membrane beta-barrel domain-containing protein [Pseudomonas costantinii]|uniref:Autotransporter outer membrane beta-barrel domain-containing protein n=1 Tax=Pseudomonas costantinii TaxID=168469 RepID=A0A1S2V039_9PSED|nr:autotransporter outer membrane beta-barrel domain-containing protein [Pseudomonas costantinii]NVZ20351.1 autotransporter outer membrane beta-barrel domain-containing protein [Pseudomonas costantinii]OIN52054.1 autotransporter outer membrane beta-barrel domain-containing protein [Pseudomonas costantinii]SEE49083.1 outer membrane autotransporter barrel domain-containing protein [Pseudomonas costantinii]
MSAVFNFKQTPLSIALAAPAVTLLFLVAPDAQARTEVVRPGTTISSTTAVDNYVLRPGSSLISVGATTNQIDMQGAGLTLQPGSQTQEISATLRSSVVVDGSRVTARPAVATAILVNSNSSALITNKSIVSNAGGFGVTASRSLAGTDGSTVTVIDSSVSGLTRGISASAYSVVNLDRAVVEGTGAAGTGLVLANADGFVRNNSRVVGGLNGVNLRADSNLSRTNTLILDNSVVEGRTGSAILVNPSVNSGALNDIQVLNGSNLIGGNGVLMEVGNNATANLNIDNSALIGDVVIGTGSTGTVQLNNNASLTGQLFNVKQLDVNSGAQWVLVGDSQVDALKMGGGSVVFGTPTQYLQLNTNNLTGNGTFAMHTNFNTGETDLLNVSGNAEGNHQLLIAASGSELATGEAIKVVHTESGGAKFGLVGDTVDVGAFEYGLKQEGTDWLLDTEKKGTSTSAKAVLALATAAPAVLIGESSVLRTRMGEVRFGEGKSQGLWMRGYGNKIDVAANSNGVGYSQNQNGFTLGFDNTLNEEWTVGVLGGYSNSKLGLSRGSSGMVNSFYAGIYGIWQDDSGVYVDVGTKYNRLNGQSQVNMSDGQRAKGKYTQDAVSGWVEVGRKMPLNDEGAFIEPFAKLDTAVIGGSNYTMDNGLKAKSDRSLSAIGKVGVTLGNDIQLDSGAKIQPFVRVAAARDFSPDSNVYINDQKFKNNLSGAGIEGTVGMAVALSSTFSMHAELSHGKGKAYDTPYSGTVGVQWAF